MSEREPLKFAIILPFRRGDRVRISSAPYQRGIITGIDVHMHFSDEPHVVYCVRTDTLRHVNRYVSEKDLILIGECNVASGGAR